MPAVEPDWDIRPVRTPAEQQAALALLEAEWPGEGDWFRQELTDPHFAAGPSLIAVCPGAGSAEDTVAGHVQIARPRPMQFGQAWLTAGGLHGLVVSPRARRRGLGRRLVAAAHRALGGLGATVSLVFATEPAFYEPLGYGRTFPLYSTVIAAEAAARAGTPFAVRPFQPAELPRVAAAYATAPSAGAIGAFARTAADWRWLVQLLQQPERSRLRPFFGKERQLLVRAGAGGAPGYAWTGVDASRLWVFEAACPLADPSQQLAAAARWLAVLGTRALIRGQRELAITAPPGHPLADAAYRQGGSRIHRLGPGMACVLDLAAVLAEVAPELQARLDRLAGPAKWPPAVQAELLPAGLVAGASARLPAGEGHGTDKFAAPPALWARLLFGQAAAEPDCPPVPPLLHLLFPPATPHIWPADNRF